MNKAQMTFRKSYEKALDDIQYLDLVGAITHGDAKKAFARVGKHAAKLGLVIERVSFRKYAIKKAELAKSGEVKS